MLDKLVISKIRLFLFFLAGCCLAGATQTKAGTFSFTFTDKIPDRVIYEVPVAPQPGVKTTPTALVFTLQTQFPKDLVRGISVHVKSGNGFYNAELPAEHKKGTYRIAFPQFSAEGKPGAIEKATLLRISVWKKDPKKNGSGKLELKNAYLAAPAPIAVVCGGVRTAPGASELSKKFARKAFQLYQRAGFTVDEIPDDFSPAALSGIQLLVLPYAPKCGPSEVAQLRAFIRGGGKIIVFYLTDPSLFSLLGIAPAEWDGNDVGWSAMEIAEPFAPAGQKIPHLTTNRAILTPKKSRFSAAASVAAYWVDAKGRRTKKPAVTLAASGACFGHIPPLAYPSAVRLLADLSMRLVPSLAPQLRYEETMRAPLPTEPVGGYLGKESFPVRGVWVPSSRNLRTHSSWEKLLPALEKEGLNTVFFHCGSGVFPSVSGVPVSTKKKGMYSGISLHAWVPVFSMNGISEAQRKRLPKSLKTIPSFPNWLDAKDEKTRTYLIGELVKIARSGVAGIHLDYVRTPEGVPETPENTKAISQFVSDAARAIRKANSSCVISAAVFQTPKNAKIRNQNWVPWIKERAVDFVTPMIYTDSPELFQTRLKECTAAVPAGKIVPGLSTGADESQLSLSALCRDLLFAREQKCGGISFYALDEALLDYLHAL